MCTITLLYAGSSSKNAVQERGMTSPLFYGVSALLAERGCRSTFTKSGALAYGARRVDNKCHDGRRKEDYEGDTVPARLNMVEVSVEREGREEYGTLERLLDF